MQCVFHRHKDYAQMRSAQYELMYEITDRFNENDSINKEV